MKKFFLLLIFLSIELLAVNTVILKNGKNIKGKVTNQDEKGLTIQLSDGSTQSIAKSQILKVIYKDLSEQEAEKVRLAEEKKLREKEEKERLRLEKEQQLAEEKERKRLEEEAKKAEALAQKDEEANRIQREKDAAAEAAWIAARTLGPSPANTKCGGRFAIFWRSAVLPGWGQYCGGHTVSAAVFGSLFFGTLGYSLTTLKNQEAQAKENYESLALYNQILGPSTRFTPQFITTSDEFVGVFVENILVNDVVSESRNEAKAANARYLGGLGATGIIYIANLINAYWIGRDTYPERPRVALGGKSFKEGWDWEARFDTPVNPLLPAQAYQSLYGEFRYSHLWE